ncbi:MAG TPA: carboxyl transferase domain-containing protein [Polyangiaceae bacterium LLY-WYZ-15_(1-7)]|nr:propionyl-CoA carboxylase [Myxococcales bacterium]MAT29385.1 propionyl-CoA carboxylase [Sandaracinus sp.]HJL01384.1 carboxyl transferase domain-containing protein [Polyangiaceae bacterium LLY-WYZ-15_(1-7)]HJL07699.1 carboxyl transferase domain-containing protein [Polyangiaceae bacterium LLY-WYZ-15_(1-7)]HJL25524.1 carboxyl transferase domain-containing protein [Polyangiaceae bacterium LLY-WYZ-15_(1-7)]
MAHVPVRPIGAPREQVADDRSFAEQREALAELEQRIVDRRAEVHAGWGQKYVERVHAKGKLTARERLARLVDPGTDVFEVGTFVNQGERFGKLSSPGAGVVTAFARIEGRWCMVIANDNTVASGAWWPRTPEKIQRAQKMALRLRLPTIYLVDCSGLFLPEQSRSFSGARGAGHIFKMNSLLSAEGVPQIAGVFGDCIAGGGYMPIISDRVYMTEQAYMVIAGAALIKGAKSQKITSLDIGGPEVHVHQSGCADVRVPDDETLLTKVREEVARLPSSAAPFYRGDVGPVDPLHPPRELAGLLPVDHREAYDATQVLARLCDQSLFWEVLPDVGKEMICGVGRVGGLWAGFVINRQGLVGDPEHPEEVRPAGTLYKAGIAKIAAFSRACDADGIPLVWLQDISGFDIGQQAEAQGLLAYGSSLIYTNSTNTTPMFTVLLRKASGAGYYAMAGLPYDPVVQLSTALSRLSVMEGRTLAIATYNTKLDDDFEIVTDDAEERAEIEQGMKDVEARIEKDMDPFVAARQMDTDEIVRLGELRSWLEVLVECSYQSIGHRRVKNPRIWSLHDLQVLVEGIR